MDCPNTNNPRRLLRAVDRVITLFVYAQGGGEPTPVDLSDVEVAVYIKRDGSNETYTPESVSITGDDNNLVEFRWPAIAQKHCGRYTIELLGDFGDEGVSRTNWHGPNGLELVEYSEQATPSEVADLSIREVSLTGTMEAAFGSGYYIKPEGGIPASDMTQEVQESLHKADGAAPQETTYTKTEVDTAIGNEATERRTADGDLANAISNHVNNGNIHVTTANKAAWDAKYDKPGTGIPKTDLASGVQSSLGAADTAYQKPQAGIPASDIADGVIPDVSQFITKSVNDLVNYYLKSDTYTRAEVQQLIDAIKQFTYEVVAELPAASAATMNKIYLVPSSNPDTQNVKDEFITIRSGEEGSYVYSWEQIGSTTIDLSNYYTKAQTDAAISEALNTALAAYTTTADLTTLLSGKVDKVAGKGLSTNDYTNEDKAKLGGVEAGAQENVIETVKVNGTALTPTEKAVDVPVPTQLSQLSEDTTHRVVTDTEKTAWGAKYDKPSGGIPASDIADGVIPDVSQFITKNVSDLVNYYLKSETFTKDEVNALISAITDLIPSAATALNQLADKAFVNSSISTATATHRGTFNLVSDLGLTTSATEQQIAAVLATEIATADNNDYAFVQIPTSDATPTQIARVDRYKFNGTAWAYEYTLNNSGYTAAQWAAINSAINSELVAKLSALPTNSELTTALGGKVDKENGKGLSTEDYTTAEKGKLGDLPTNSELTTALGNKADKSEMSVTPGTGANADKTTIQLKEGTSATVLTSHQDISGKADKDTDAVEGHLAKFDANGNPVDGDIAINNVAQKDGSYDQMQVGVAKDLASSQSVPAEIVFRNTGGSTSVGKGGTAIIDRIKGKTLAWNQLVNPVTFGASEADFTDGVKYVNNGDGSFSIIVAEGGATAYRQCVACILITNADHVRFLKPNCNDPLSPSTIQFFTGYGSYERDTIIPVGTYGVYVAAVVYQGCPAGTYTFKPYLSDLTLLYGTEIDGMTDAEILAKFESEYPGYHDHDEGTLISNDASAIETVGFNQWDEEWEVGDSQLRSKNLIPVFPNTAYYITMLSYPDHYHNKIFYNAEGEEIGRDLTDAQSFTTPADCAYMRFVLNSGYGTTYNNDICINLSDPSRNGTYEPYWKSQVQLNLDDFYVKDPSGGADIHITGGLKSAGSVYDEIVGNKYIKRVGEVDLGSVNAGLQTGTNVFNMTINGIKRASNNNERKTGIICSNYAISSNYSVSQESMSDKSVLRSDSADCVYLKDTSITTSDISNGKIAKLSGVLLYYELATPIEYELVEALPTEYRVDSHGTERRLPEDTASSVHAPFCAEITYSTNIKETVENLPKNYINVDSMHAFLAALGTAMNGEWDMRQGNGRFIFTFTPNTPNTQNENE